MTVFYCLNFYLSFAEENLGCEKTVLEICESSAIEHGRFLNAFSAFVAVDRA